MKSITIATPMYGGMATNEYLRSTQELMDQLNRRGYKVTQLTTVNESLITRARNTLAHEFMKGSSEALLFVDADHGFNSHDVVKMIESGEPLIGAPYPMKAINWEAVRDAALTGKPDLHLYSGYYAVNMLPDVQDFSSDKPFPVRDVGTGMLYVRRSVFEEMAEHCRSYLANTGTEGIGVDHVGDRVTEYFYTEVDPEFDVLLSEDYAFCALWRRLGHTVHSAPWVRISHIGHYEFTGSFTHSLVLKTEMARKAAREAGLPLDEPLN